MILNLTIERQGLPPARVRWSTDSLSATHSAANHTDPTIAQLIEQVNEVIPLEDAEWGLEDYAVESNGFECLHFCRVSQVLKENDHLTIRPWQTQEVRFRTISGRSQISSDGRHLIDGVSFGRPFLRRGLRPQIRIQPKKRPRANLDDNRDYDDEDELAPAGLLIQAAADRPVEMEDDELATRAFSSTGPGAHLQDYMQNLAPRMASTGEQPLKRRLEPAFGDERAGKRVRSALQPALVERTNRLSSTNSKNVRFDDAAPTPSDATPSTIHAPLESEDEEEDEDFDPESDASEPESDSDSGSESNKENLNPETHQYAPQRASSDASPRGVSIATTVANTLAELTDQNQRLMTPGSPSGSTASSSSSSDTDEDLDADSDDESDSSEESSSDEETSSSGSDASEAVSEVPYRPVNTAETSLSEASPKPVPPGEGKLHTKSRNKRRKESAALAKLKENGHLDPSATLADLRDWKAKQSQNNHETQQARLKAHQQALLDAIASGGVDISEHPTYHKLGSRAQDKPCNPDEVVVMDNELSRPARTHYERGSSPRQALSRYSPKAASQASPRIASNDSLRNGSPGNSSAADSPPDPKRRKRLDLGAAQRMMLANMGIRAPKTEVEADKLRDASRQKSQKEFEKHQRRDERDQIQKEAPADEQWQDHVELKSVECADPSIKYSNPPFPFQQRWDPQQDYNNWRPHHHGKKGRSAKRKWPETDIEEHYDASMYDEQPAEAGDDQFEAMAVDSEPMPVTTQPLARLDVSDKVDLLLEHALAGAKIAFKQLEVSEATNWSPQVSEYKSALVTENQDGTLILLLDEEYRLQREIDPETGGVVASRFIIAEAQDDDDEGILELSYSELVEPKLLSAAITPVASQEDKSKPSSTEQHINTIDAIANGVSISPVIESFSTTIEAGSGVNTSNGTAASSFNTSIHTAVKHQSETSAATSTTAQNRELVAIDTQARDEASMLIRDAGFRSAVDPEATKPLKERHQRGHTKVQSGGSERDSRSQTDFRGFSDPPDDEEDKDKDEESGSDSPSQSLFVSEEVSRDDRDFNMEDDVDHANSNGAKASSKGAGPDLTVGSINQTNAQANRDIDMISLQDSSQEMVTEILQEVVQEIPEPGNSTPSSVVHHPGSDVDLVRHILTAGGTHQPSPRDSSPDAAPISPDDVEEVPEAVPGTRKQQSRSDVPDLDELLDDADSVPVTHSQPPPAKSNSVSQTSESEPVSKKTYGSRRNTSDAFPSTQPEPSRNTRLADRNAAAKAAPILIIDSDDDEPSTAPPSTVPVTSGGFTPINLNRSKAPSASQPVNRRHTINPGDPMDFDDDSDGADNAAPRRASPSQSSVNAVAAFKARLQSRKSSAGSRTKSTV